MRGKKNSLAEKFVSLQVAPLGVKLHFKLCHKKVFKMLRVLAPLNEMLRMSFFSSYCLGTQKVSGREKVFYFRQITWQVQKKQHIGCVQRPLDFLNLKFVFKEPLGLRGASRFTQTHRPLCLKSFSLLTYISPDTPKATAEKK